MEKLRLTADTYNHFHAPLRMNSEQATPESVDETRRKFKRHERHLQVSSVTYPERSPVDWNRKAHSSPSKSFRRFSGQESNYQTNQVCGSH